MKLDTVIHEPARLLAMSLLCGREQAEFAEMLALTGLTKGNLSSHITRLEEAGYVAVLKSFHGKLPRTAYQITGEGREALLRYWAQLDEIRLHCRAPKGRG